MNTNSIKKIRVKYLYLHCANIFRLIDPCLFLSGKLYIIPFCGLS